MGIWALIMEAVWNGVYLAHLTRLAVSEDFIEIVLQKLHASASIWEYE